MSLICPKDWKPCVDDLCRGGGCLETGDAMVEICDTCKSPTDDCDCPCPMCASPLRPCDCEEVD